MAGPIAPVTNAANNGNTPSITKNEIVQESKDLHKAINTALENEAGGAPVHTFNPDATAEEKKQEILKSAAPTTATTVKKTPGSFVKEAAPAIPDWYNIGWTAFSNLPNPGDEKAMAEFLKTHTPEQVKEAYYNSRSSNGNVDDFIAQFVNEKYFGEWYHNCGVVFVCIFFTWLLIKLRLGLMSCFIVGAFFGK